MNTNGKLDMLITQTNRIETKVDTNSKAVSTLVGKFDEHLSFSDKMYVQIENNSAALANGHGKTNYKLMAGMIGITGTLVGVVMKLIR